MALPGWGKLGSLPFCDFFWTFLLVVQMLTGFSSCLEQQLCHSNCTCRGDLLDCSNLGLEEVPAEMPTWAVAM